jgi:hypothetical protein
MRFVASDITRLAGWTIPFAIVAALGGCAADAKRGEGNGDESVEPVSLDDFHHRDGRWTLRVNRTWDGTTPVSLPTDMLSEEDYDSAPQPTAHPVMVAHGTVTVTVGSNPMAGSPARTSTATRLMFDLTSGTFAGGRFLVWEGSKGLEAELTIYGSGRPIVQSERGDLVPAP